MYDFRRFYIDGTWVTPSGRPEHLVIDPATEEPCGRIFLGSGADVELAVRAARNAFDGFAESSREERIALLERIIVAFKRRIEDVARAISQEMGAPKRFALNSQAESGLEHLTATLEVLKTYEFEQKLGTT